MALFERKYRAAATTELERSIRDIEERDKIAQTKNGFSWETADVQCNLNFAERLGLISAAQAEAYRQRVLQAQLDFANMQRTETRGDMVDSFENPRERAARYQGMDAYNARIAAERADSAAAQGTREPEEERER